MCRRAITDINWPGPNSPDGCRNELIGSGSIAEKTEPRRCLDCCSAITVTTTEASPATMAARASPARGQCGGKANFRNPKRFHEVGGVHLLGVACAGARVVSEAVDIGDGK